MSNKPFNPTAFPLPSDVMVGEDSGMSLRDYFAGQALAGLVSQPEAGSCGDWTDNQVAEWSYKFADAMLAEREKNP